MSSNKKSVSKPGTVGEHMAQALKGDYDTEGGISGNYKGRPRNAQIGHDHNPANSKPVSEWTQNHMQEQRKKNKDANDK